MEPVKQPEDNSNERIAIQKILDEETISWNNRDAEGYSKHFAEEGTFTNILGSFATGKQTFKEKHDKIFKGVFSKSTFAQKLVSLNFVRADVAIAETFVTVVDFPKIGAFQGLHTDDKGRFHTYLLQVMVKEDDEWKIFAYHNVDVKRGGPLVQP